MKMKEIVRKLMEICSSVIGWSKYTYNYGLMESTNEPAGDKDVLSLTRL